MQGKTNGRMSQCVQQVQDGVRKTSLGRVQGRNPAIYARLSSQNPYSIDGFHA